MQERAELRGQQEKQRLRWSDLTYIVDLESQHILLIDQSKGVIPLNTQNLFLLNSKSFGVLVKLFPELIILGEVEGSQLHIFFLFFPLYLIKSPYTSDWKKDSIFHHETECYSLGTLHYQNWTNQISVAWLFLGIKLSQDQF